MDQFEEKKWFVFLGDHHEGPFSMADIQTKIDDKLIGLSSFVWAEGMDDWKVMNEIPAFGTFKKQSDKGPSAEPSLVFKQEAAAQSLPLDQRPLSHEPPPQKVASAWRRRRLLRRLAGACVFLVVAGGAAVIFGGVLEAEWLRPKLAGLTEKYPILSSYISPIPRLADVGSEDYLAIRSAASARLDTAGPSVAIALSKGDFLNPSFYVTSNLPDGAQFDVYVDGVSDSLLNQLHATAKVTVTVSQKLAKTPQMDLPDGKPLPKGEYQVYVTESENQPAEVKELLARLQPLNAAGTDRLPAGLKLLARRTYFLGGPKDASYSQKLKEYHDKLHEKAALEIAELKQLVGTLEEQMNSTVSKFKDLRKSKAKKKSWSSFHVSWEKRETALTEPFQKTAPEVFQSEYIYAGLYQMLQQADQASQKLHALQNDYFEKKVDERALEIQLGEKESVTQSALAALKTKLDQLETAAADSTSKDGMPPTI